jgi:hypothetical protein
MKKLLVMMLVLGVASLATAGLIMITDGSSITITNDTVYDNPSLTTGQFMGMLAIPDGQGVYDGTFSWGPAAVQGSVYGYGPGIPASSFGVNWLPGTFDVTLIAATDGTTSLLGVGNVVTLGITNPVTMAYLFDINGNPLYIPIPEPITISLLAVGALFLRRRK